MAYHTRVNEKGEVSCPRCKRWLPEDWYYKPAPKQRGKYSIYCKDCVRDKGTIDRLRKLAKSQGIAAVEADIKHAEHVLELKREALQWAKANLKGDPNV